MLELELLTGFQFEFTLSKVNREEAPETVASKPLAPLGEPVICVPYPGLGLKFVDVSPLFTPSCQFSLMLVVVFTELLIKR